MYKNLNELNKAIEKKRAELNEKIEKHESYTEILKVSQELDELIALYYEKK